MSYPFVDNEVRLHAGSFLTKSSWYCYTSHASHGIANALFEKMTSIGSPCCTLSDPPGLRIVDLTYSRMGDGFVYHGVVWGENEK